MYRFKNELWPGLKETFHHSKISQCSFKRRKSIEVKVAGLAFGANHPIRIQSMLNTDPLNTKACVEQIISLMEADCQMVRLAIPNKQCALNLKSIHQKLLQEKVSIPLVADIHFNPDLALTCLPYVDKVRINPGNFAQKAIGKHASDNFCFEAEEEFLEAQFRRLIKTLKLEGKALRIGVNQGSVSFRILQRFGNTPEALIHSALEFLEVAKEEKFNDIFLSVKSSIPSEMLLVNQKLVEIADQYFEAFPLHLGVTEAGAVSEGTLKSAIGTGSLLVKGIGDTIRVSLTGDPLKELEPAKQIIQFSNSLNLKLQEQFKESISPFLKKASQSSPPYKLSKPLIGLDLSSSSDSWESEIHPSEEVDFVLPSNKDGLITLTQSKACKNDSYKVVYMSWDQPSLFENDYSPDVFFLYKCSIERLYMEFYSLKLRFPNFFAKHSLLLSLPNLKNQEHWFYLVFSLSEVLLRGDVKGVVLPFDSESNNNIKTVLDLYQSLRLRMNQPDFIACPSCGRTQFNIEESLKKVKEATKHLKGLKIAVMGCIVNGPGEMADADYGYIGAGKGKVSIYKKQNKIENNIPESLAVEKLIGLIKKDGNWFEPSP